MADVFRASVQGVARTKRDLSRAEREMHDHMVATMRDLGKKVMRIYQVNAPGRLGTRVRGGISSSVMRPMFVITVDATDERTGYDYLPITRFGHRRKWIKPDDGRGEAFVVATHVRRAPNRGTRPALRFRDSRTGKIIYRYRVRGVRRSHDWVRESRSEAQPLIQEATTRLGRRVVSSFR